MHHNLLKKFIINLFAHLKSQAFLIIYCHEGTMYPASAVTTQDENQL
jgi:hypothetical protein